MTAYPTRAAARRARNRARRIRRATVTVVGAAVLALLTTGAARPAPVAAHPEPFTVVQELPVPMPPQEDDPTWDCRINGNHSCGATDPATGTRYVVTFSDDGNTVLSVTPLGDFLARTMKGA